MRVVLKKIYMLIVHPILFFRFTINNNLFVKNGANIKNLSKIKLGNDVAIGTEVRINFFGSDENAELEIGDRSYFCNRVSFLIGSKIRIGNDVLVASDVCITSENHGVDPMSELPYKQQELICKDVQIGDGTWIGEKVVILPGVSVGTKCVIGAGSIVTKDIPDMCIAVGNPARVIKKYDVEKGMWVRTESI